MEQFLQKMNFKLSLHKHGKNLFIFPKNDFFSKIRDRKIISMQILPQALGRSAFYNYSSGNSTSEDTLLNLTYQYFITIVFN
jgi:hypothetical protein